MTLSGIRDAIQRPMPRLLTLVCVLCALIPAQATTLTRASLDDLIQKSTSIVRGRVLNSSSSARGLLVYTYYKIQVLDRWKGAAAEQVQVQVPGGSFHGVQQNIAGSPVLADGSEYVFFLWTGPSGASHVLGLSQGVLDVGRDSAGNAILIRQPGEATVLDALTGVSGNQEPLQMKLSDFNSRVAGALKGVDKTK